MVISIGAHILMQERLVEEEAPLWTHSESAIQSGNTSTTMTTPMYQHSSMHDITTVTVSETYMCFQTELSQLETYRIIFGSHALLHNADITLHRHEVVGTSSCSLQ